LKANNWAINRAGNGDVQAPTIALLSASLCTLSHHALRHCPSGLKSFWHTGAGRLFLFFEI